MDDEGEPSGHIRGIYGRRENGEQVFFGKFINREGEFKGIFRGEYGDGHFGGRWIHRAGERGVSVASIVEGVSRSGDRRPLRRPLGGDQLQPRYSC